jgi:DUF1365 family protein
MSAPAPTALIGFGEVASQASAPGGQRLCLFNYFLMLPLRSLRQAAATPKGSWAINRPGPLSFFETDHGDGRSPSQGGAIAWLDELLHSQGIEDATGEVWLHTYPRVLGFTFKPVSFWYCHRAPDDQGGALRAIVVEVNNTFGERHCYLLDAPRYGVEQLAAKVFHVSPFCPVQGHYRFRFMRSQHGTVERTVARIDYCDTDPQAESATTNKADDVLLQTSVSGTLEPLTRAALRRALWRYPAMTLGVVLHIHLQALRLWCSKVPFFANPRRPARLYRAESTLITIANSSSTPSLSTPQPLELTMNTATTTSPRTAYIAAPTVSNMPASARSALKLLENLRFGALTLQLPDGTQRRFGEHPQQHSLPSPSTPAPPSRCTTGMCLPPPSSQATSALPKATLPVTGARPT